MSEIDQAHYNALADQAEAGEFTPTGEKLTGQAAREAAAAMFRQAVGTDDFEEILKAGRPTLEESMHKPAGDSPQVSFRVPRELYDQLGRLAEPGQSANQVARRLLAEHLDQMRGHAA